MVHGDFVSLAIASLRALENNVLSSIGCIDGMVVVGEGEIAAVVGTDRSIGIVPGREEILDRLLGTTAGTAGHDLLSNMVVIRPQMVWLAFAMVGRNEK